MTGVALAVTLPDRGACRGHWQRRHAAILTRNYQKSIQAKEKLRWAPKVT
jgi:hypothetical protein